MPYAIIRTTKLKTWDAVDAVGRHNSRASRPTNADPAGRVVLLDGSGDLMADARARLGAAGIDPVRLRRNGVVAVEAILAASPGYFRPGRDGAAGTWDPDRLYAWLAAARAFLAAEWGDRVVSVVVHLDESTVHAHVVWLPLDDTARRRGPAVRLNARRRLAAAIAIARRRCALQPTNRSGGGKQKHRRR